MPARRLPVRPNLDQLKVCGVAGFGASSVVHSEKVLRLSIDLPLIIEVVETEERIQAPLPQRDAMIGGGLITLERAGSSRTHRDPLREGDARVARGRARAGGAAGSAQASRGTKFGG